MPEATIADFSGGLNLTAAPDKIPNREALLADACRFDQLGSVSAAGASTKQNSVAEADGAKTNIIALNINSAIRNVAFVGNDVITGATLGGMSTVLDEVNAGEELTSFASQTSKVIFDTSGTPRFINDAGSAHTIDWATPVGTSTSAGPRDGATFANDVANAGTIDWVNPGNAATSDNVDATIAALGAGERSKLLKATNFGFTIPSGAQVVGIKAEVEKQSDNVTQVIIDGDARVIKAGVPVGTNKKDVSVWPTADAYTTYGGTTDLWGTTWTPAEINASGFGFGIAAVNFLTPGVAEPATVDHIRVTVFYNNSGVIPAIGSTGVLTGTYTYKVTFVDVDGNESGASTESTSVAPSAQSVNLSSVALGDSKTVKRKLYRKGVALTSYYRVGGIDDNVTTTFSDNLSDADALTDGILLAGEIEGDRANTRIGASADVKWPEVYYDRLFWVDQATGEIIWSKPLHPFAYPAAFRKSVGDTNVPTRLIFFQGDLIIFKPDSIWRLSGTTESAFQMVRIASIGTDMPLTVFKTQESEGRIIFTNSQGFWYFDGVVVRKLTNRLDRFFEGETINSIAPPVTTAAVRAKFAAVFSNGNYYFSYADTGTTNNRLLKVDLEGGTITRFSVVALSLAVDPIDGKVYYGDGSGFIKSFDDLSATNDATASVSWAFQTKYFDFERGSDKNFTGVEFDIDSSSQSITPTVLFDGGASSEALATISTSSRQRVYRKISAAGSRKAQNISFKLTGTLSTVNESGSPAVTLHSIKPYFEILKQRSRVSV